MIGAGLLRGHPYSLTERGVSDTVVLTTGRCRDGDADPDWAGQARPGTTLVVYMAGRRLGTLARRLLDSGAPGHLEVSLAWSVSTSRARSTRMTLSDALSLAPETPDEPVLFRLDWPKGSKAVPVSQVPEKPPAICAVGS